MTVLKWKDGPGRGKAQDSFTLTNGKIHKEGIIVGNWDENIAFKIF